MKKKIYKKILNYLSHLFSYASKSKIFTCTLLHYIFVWKISINEKKIYSFVARKYARKYSILIERKFALEC